MKAVRTFIVVLTVCFVYSKEKRPTRDCDPCKCYHIHQQITADCSNLGLERIPTSIPNNVTKLNMSKNRICYIPPNKLKRFYCLQDLDLSDNNLNALDVDSFLGVDTLKRLVLHKNRIPLTYKAYPKGVFRQQQLLVSLDISKNTEDTTGVYPDEAFRDLVSLETLYVDGVQNATLREGFSGLKNLTTLSLSGNGGYCSIYNLFNDTFINTPFLTHLDISHCRIFNIEVNAFSPLKKIDTLDMSDNMYIGFDQMGDSLYGLRFSPLRVLRINRIVNTFAIGVVIEERHFRFLRDMNVKELYVDNNRIELVRDKVPGQLAGCEIISATHGRFTYGEYLLASDSLTNLTSIYFNDQYVSDKIPLPGREEMTLRASTYNKYRNGGKCGTEEKVLNYKDHQQSRGPKGPLEPNAFNQRKYPLENKYQSMFPEITTKSVYDPPPEIDASRFLVRITIPLPPKLSFLNASNSKLFYNLYEMRFTKNSVKKIDASNNFFIRWIGPFHEVQSVETVDLSNNYCVELAPTFLMFGSGLRVLNFSKNFLAESLYNDTNGLIFYNQSNLRILRLANNIIRKLPMNIFSRLKSLRYLDLSWNMMDDWSADISHMSSLRFLDLSKNRLPLIPRNLRSQIDTLMKDRNDTIHISINTNYLKCDCKSLESLQWMQKQYVFIDDLPQSECQFSDGSIVIMDDLGDIVLRLQQKCKTIMPTAISAVAGILFFLAIAAAGIVYRYRWKLRYLYYTTRRKHRGYQRLNLNGENFTYDAFVSYADEDRRFVVNDMRQILEERFGLRLCIHHRDFMVGEPITANIINAIQSSRKTIVVLTPNFVASSWCEYEVRMAKLESIHTGRDILCVVWYADVPDRRAITGDLLEEILNDTYITYPRGEQEQELFWTTLRRSLEY